MANRKPIPVTASPYEWHRRPARFVGPCPTCGCDTKSSGEHRAYKPEERMTARWVRRVRSDDGWVYTAILAANDSDAIAANAPGKKVPPGRPSGPLPATVKTIVTAARLRAYGATMEDAAAKLETLPRRLRDYQERYPSIWNTAYQKAIAEVTEIIRAQAGTDAILEDIDKYLRMALNAERWTRSKGEPLFHKRAGITLTEFFRENYLPNRLHDAVPDSIRTYETALRKWMFLTGDPPMIEVDSDLMARFRNCLTKFRGLKPGTWMSPNSIRGVMRHILAIFTKAGPAGPRNRDAVEIITRVPWAKPPHEDLGEPRIVTPEELQACYIAATAMDRPKVDGIKAPAWWRALLVVAYNTGLRRRSLFSMRMDAIDWEHRLIVLPARRMKARRLHVVHLNDAAMEHLRLIRTNRELVFPIGHCSEWFHRQFHKLQAAAGIKRTKQFGLHALRKTCATLLWGVAPQAAQLALGHAAANVTMRHYVAAGGIVAKAIDLLPQPWAQRAKRP